MLRGEHKGLQKKYEDLKLKFQKLSKTLDDIRSKDKDSICAARVIELEECLAVERRLSEDLKAELAKSTDDSGMMCTLSV